MRPFSVKKSPDIKKIPLKQLLTVESALGKITLLSLALPLLAESLATHLLSTVNTAVLGGYSPISVGAIGGATPVINIINLLNLATSTGAIILLGNMFGRGDKKGIRDISRTALLMNFFIGLFVSAVAFVLAPKIMSAMNLKGQMYDEAIIYFRIRMMGFVISSVSVVLLAILRCYGYTRGTVISGLTTNVVNLVLNIFVIKNPDRISIQMISAIAICALVGQICGVATSVGYMLIKKIKISFVCSIKEFFTQAGTILKFGFPSMISSGTFTVVSAITSSFAALIGDTAMTAKVFFTSILCYGYVFSSAIGNANTIMVGRLCGMGEYSRANLLNKTLIRFTCVLNGMVSLSIVMLYMPILSCYTEDPSIIAMALPIFIVDIIAEQARAVSQVYEYGLKATGDVYLDMIVTSISGVVLGVGLSYLLAIKLDMGLFGLYAATAADEVVRTVFSVWRWKSGAWKKYLCKKKS